MKSILFTLNLFLSVAIYACQSSEETGKQPPGQTAAEQPTADSILRDTLTNSQGIKLAMAYNNANRTATFVLAGEVIHLKQDTLAAGIKYRNAEYEYTEHQGTMTLKKGDKIVFSNP
ncbi:hypothetical protein LX87_04755 [Larkinella arboricola]|uniref:C-type lysozyme inhibitor domain-containing protein n=1 Tax=Larkinella arboricola TaxID=643671 RepID=A0A327WML1_LARAB|nr:MliC family protein [Larkinella arboricola]RAJ93243.1 hypothetical protein LX87_04755 [Larkinella arboricola]